MKFSPEETRKIAVQSGRLQPRVTLPAPPSANNLFATVKGHRVKSSEYKAWLAKAVPLLAFLAGPKAYPCRYRILLCGTLNILRDGANTEKAAIDAIVAAGVIPDDCLKYVCGGVWEFEKSDREPTLTVWLEEVNRIEGAE